jgi:hypothetical protein
VIEDGNMQIEIIVLLIAPEKFGGTAEQKKPSVRSSPVAFIVFQDVRTYSSIASREIEMK